jgi:hypothetical protein
LARVWRNVDRDASAWRPWQCRRQSAALTGWRLPGGDYRSVSLRSFDRATGIWSIWWLDGRHPQNLDVPVRGTFAGGNAEFFANDEFGGKPIKVRFRWTGTDKGSPRWEQAFSADDGATWEVNWTMDFKRPS